MVELFKHENPLVCALELSTLEYVESALFRIERGDSSLDRRERINNKEAPGRVHFGSEGGAPNGNRPDPPPSKPTGQTGSLSTM